MIVYQFDFFQEEANSLPLVAFLNLGSEAIAETQHESCHNMNKFGSMIVNELPNFAAAFNKHIISNKREKEYN